MGHGNAMETDRQTDRVLQGNRIKNMSTVYYLPLPCGYDDGDRAQGSYVDFRGNFFFFFSLQHKHLVVIGVGPVGGFPS